MCTMLFGQSYSQWRLQTRCDGGSAEACVLLADEYGRSGQDPRAERRLELLARACTLNNAQCNGLAVLATSEKQAIMRVSADRDLARKACTGGNGQACLTGGRMYKNGTAPDPSQAIPLFEDACDQNMAEGCREAGQFYMDGRDVPVDLEKARVLLDKACSEGDGAGCSSLGLLFLRTEPPNLDSSTRYFGSACNLNDANGCFQLGKAVLAGQGTAPDTGQARAAFEKACRLKIDLCDDIMFFDSTRQNIPETTPAGSPPRPTSTLDFRVNLDPALVNTADQRKTRGAKLK
jgi:TPR repeat protein